MTGIPSEWLGLGLCPVDPKNHGRRDALNRLRAAAQSEADKGDGRAKRALERLIEAAGLGEEK